MKTKITAGCLLAAFSLFTISSFASTEPTTLTSATGKIVVTPVSLLYFKVVTIEKRYAELNWATAFESENSVFIIERSNNRKNFVPLIEIKAVGNSQDISTYQFVDPRPIKTITYYRLVQVDNNGQSTELHTAVIRPS